MVDSYHDLWVAHEKMVRREKKRDEFFSKMWKWVKVLWKVIQPRDRLSSS